MTLVSFSENQLETWAKQGATGQSRDTYASIKATLEAGDSPYAGRSFSVFLQGSYKNDTNVYAESDVDIVIVLDEIYSYETGDLKPDEVAKFASYGSAATYTYADFKRDVLAHLKARYGGSVQAGKKAILVPGSGNRRDADVLVAIRHRRYTRFQNSLDQNYYEGICFYTADGTRIANYPEYHSDNATSKHQSSNSWFKPTARTFKNIRNKLVADGWIEDGLAPSYFIEGLLYNVPNHRFGGSHTANFYDCFNWLIAADRSDFICVNERYYLLREGSPVTWRAGNCDAFLAAVAAFSARS